LAGHPDKVRLDYHPALNRPAISRYSATTPELLRWFKTYNADRSYRDQVKPFGFLLSMTQKFAIDEPSVATHTRGRPRKPRGLKPIAPFDRAHEKAVALAFDRETGKPIPATGLKTYTEALAQYHLHPESKFLNADYLDRGTTVRRHIYMTGTHHIGKESHDWERQTVLGLNLDSDIAYGKAVDDLPTKLQSLIDQFGERTAAKALGIPAARLRKLATASESDSNTLVVQAIALRLPAALRLCEKLNRDRNAELKELRAAVKRDGLRQTARRLGTDPSNLRRRLRSV
jgi:hypothetical protein